jgi:hypothetical protein
MGVSAGGGERVEPRTRGSGPSKTRGTQWSGLRMREGCLWDAD